MFGALAAPGSLSCTVRAKHVSRNKHILALFRPVSRGGPQDGLRPVQHPVDCLAQRVGRLQLAAPAAVCGRVQVDIGRWVSGRTAAAHATGRRQGGSVNPIQSNTH